MYVLLETIIVIQTLQEKITVNKKELKFIIIKRSRFSSTALKKQFMNKNLKSRKLINNYEISKTPLKDCYIIEPTIFEDERGYF